MFRNPRENATKSPAEYLPPSLGRPPSPPASRKTSTPAREIDSPKTRSTANMAAVGSSPLPTIGRGSTNPRKSNASANNKAKGKPNGSILTFFKKAEDEEEALFVQSRGGRGATTIMATSGFESHDWSAGKENEGSERFNESSGAVKRRKLNDGSPTLPAQASSMVPSVKTSEVVNSEPTSKANAGYVGRKQATALFMEDSDGEAEEEREEETSTTVIISPKGTGAPVGNDVGPLATAAVQEEEPDAALTEQPPALPREETSFGPSGDFADFEELGDFDEDVFEEGDEFVEKRWMQEQARLEAEEAGADEVDFTDGDASNFQVAGSAAECAKRGEVPACPICSITLGDISDQDAAIHVNNCLDGNPTPLPSKARSSPSEEVQGDSTKQADRFRKVPRAPKPGQANPFVLGESSNKTGSAFSKLMSGHAEDAAWADAAAAEKASFGKPSYQRTCPFYKILPGFNICVDAFRYGAVEGCRAYFLSHFHSDHYVGLTSNWCHGPIYCSKVTANLVKQQLRVDPQYVIALDWETKVEVPGSNGVFVTMISANHCPGSSLYLYEKVIGRGPKPRTQRVLHCGDFRACKAHVEHPLLRPDVIDAVSGKKRDQKIDVCYLDTTYLNPKYAFPSQEAVIQACADMCISLSKVRADESDGWETMKRERAGAGMVKFIKRESEEAPIKQEEEDTSEIEDVKPEKEALDAMAVMKRANEKHRGRLLVVVGTYSIGKERICLGIAKALNSKIYAPSGKQRICRALEDPEITSRLTSDPTEAQVHMTPLFEIRAETLDDYLKDYKDHFSRAVGFRPSGWNYRPPNSRFTDSPSVSTVLHSDNWKSGYSMKELVPQRGSTSRASCFGVPYSEHSSFRELTMFCCALRIDKIIPTVNIGNAKTREKMKGWCEKWAMERRKNGLFKLEEGDVW